MANNNSTAIGKTKRATDNMIDEASAQQNGWLNRRRNFTRRFLKSVNVFYLFVLVYRDALLDWT